MLQYTKKLNPAVFVPTFFLVILEIAKTFSSILLPQYFIDDITNRSSIRQTMFHLAILIIAIFGIQIFRAAITPYILKAYNQGDANTALDYAFHYVKMEYKDQENDEIRNTQEKLRRNVTANGFVADDLSGFFINLFLVIGFSFIMVRLHVLIYLVFFVIAICNYEFEKKRERYKYEYDQNISKTQRKLTYLFEILIDFQYAKEMRINQASKWASDKIDKEVKEYNQKLSAHTKKLCQLNFFETVLLAIINAVSYGYVVYLAYNGSISIGQMTMYIGTMLAFAQAVGGLLASVNRLNMFSVYVKDYETYLENVTSSNKSLLAQTSSQKEGSYDIEFVDVSFKYPNSNTFALQNISFVIYKDIIQIDEAVLVITAAVSLSSISEQFSNAFSDLMKSGTFVTDFRTCVNLSLKKEAENQNKPFLSENKSRMEIVFDHVSFRYPGKEQYILQDFSLKIHAGEKIAIVGLNGSGKTTLVKLLCRFYIPDEGQILLNGRNIYEYNEEEYNSFISTVFQDYKLFSFSLKDNILLGKTENPEDINIALKKSGFSQRLKTLDNGLDTLYSKEFDKNGVELSGGESQKLAIARACYKDAPIIILDEPTASLDAVAEYEIYAGFEKLVENKTAIIISHRLSSTHFCDRIIVINNGTVFEDGTHQSLMAKESGIYKKMFTTQAAHYFSDPTTVAVVD